MAVFKKSDQARINDPGFGEKIGKGAKRIINPDGSFNVVRRSAGKGAHGVYQTLLELSNTHFIITVLVSFVVINLFFAILYYWVGTEHLIGVRGETPLEHFLDCFYFSSQTFTTVGYGAIAPRGVLASTIASLEAFTGLLTFALATGLLYARFSKPRALLVYSKNAIISPYQEGKALMFRLANSRNNVLMEMDAQVILMMGQQDDINSRKYYRLKLEVSYIQFVPLSWTLVHKIDEESPLFGLKAEDLYNGQAEVLILIKAFDDTFNQTIHSRYSYVAEEFVWDVKFKKAFSLGADGNVELNLQDLHVYNAVDSSN
jgi:inward rectifier potassium channel